MRTLLGNIAALALLCLLWACGVDRTLQSALDRAEALMEIQPDSALALLRPYDTIPDGSEEQRARFALLYSMALDKNYVDTADISVIQPALDYYPTHGTDADKLRTLYYAGVIHENADSLASAMQAWADALQYQGPETDSLTLARLLVAQGNEYYRLYQFQKFVENQRKAEEIYRAIGKKDFADKAFLNQFELSLNRDSTFAKKNIGKVDRLATDSISPNAELARSKAIQYEMHFGSAQSLDARLKMYEGLPIDSLDLTQALLNLGRINEAEDIFKATQPDSDRRIKYLLRKMRLAEARGNLEEALASSKEVLHVFDRKQSSIIEGDTQFAEERSQWRHKEEEHKKWEKNAWLYGIICVLAVLLIAGGILYRVRSKNLRREQELLAQIADRDAEMKQKIAVLNNEKAVLSELLAKEPEPAELPDTIRERLTNIDALILDSLMKSVGASQGPAVPLSSILTDTGAFLENSGKTLEALYRRKTAELKEKGLTYRELGFIYLYLIGLRGKEIGVLLKRTNTYKISSAIRKKLGVEAADGKLDVVVREFFQSP